jgi:hypothetical protein
MAGTYVAVPTELHRLAVTDRSHNAAFRDGLHSRPIRIGGHIRPCPTAAVREAVSSGRLRR